MRITHCARIAAYTMLGKKRHTLRVFINMLLISCALVVWLVLTTALRSAHDAYIYGTLSSNYETVMLSLDASSQAIESRALQQAVQWDEIAQPVVAAQPDLVQVLGRQEEWIFVNNRLVTLMLDGTAHPGINDYSYDFFEAGREAEPTTVPFRIWAVYSEQIVSQNDLTEFAYRYPDAQWLLCGTAQLGQGDLLISDYMLEKFGLTGDPAQYLGTKLSILVDGEPLLESYRLTGVINRDLFRCTGLAEMPQIFVQGNEHTTRLFQLDSAVVKLPIKSYDHITDVLSRLEDQGIFINHSSWLRAKYYYNINAIHLIIERLLSVFGCLVLLAILLNLYRILAEEANHKCRQYGMLRAVGMPIPGLLLVSYLELLFGLLISTVLSLFVSFGALAVIDRITYALIHMHLALPLRGYLQIGGWTLGALLLVFLAMDMGILWHYVRCRPIALLRGRTNDAMRGGLL